MAYIAIENLGLPELESVRRLREAREEKEEASRFREYGVKGMKWGQRKQKVEKAKPVRKAKGEKEEKGKPLVGKTKITILMGVNGSGKSTILKALVKQHGAGETKIQKQKWNILEHRGNKAVLMGNYSTDRHINGGRYLIRGTFWKLLEKGLPELKAQGVKNLIIDSKRLGFGEQHDKMVKFCERKGIELNFVRVKTPLNVAQDRIGARKEAFHKTSYSMKNLEMQDRMVGQSFEKHPGLTITNDKDSDPKTMGAKLGKFVLR